MAVNKIEFVDRMKGPMPTGVPASVVPAIPQVEAVTVPPPAPDKKTGAPHE